jgi:hypothetical protein
LKVLSFDKALRGGETEGRGQNQTAAAELEVGDDGFHRPGWAKWPGGLGARNVIGSEQNEKEIEKRVGLQGDTG